MIQLLERAHRTGVCGPRGLVAAKWQIALTPNLWCAAGQPGGAGPEGIISSSNPISSSLFSQSYLQFISFDVSKTVWLNSLGARLDLGRRGGERVKEHRAPVYKLHVSQGLPRATGGLAGYTQYSATLK